MKKLHKIAIQISLTIMFAGGIGQMFSTDIIYHQMLGTGLGLFLFIAFIKITNEIFDITK